MFTGQFIQTTISYYLFTYFNLLYSYKYKILKIWFKRNLRLIV